MRPLLAPWGSLTLTLLLLAGPPGLSKTERNLLGYLPSELLSARAGERPAVLLGCEGEPAALHLQGKLLRSSVEGDEVELAIDKVEATNAGWGLHLSRTGADKRDPHAFFVEFQQLDGKQGLWRVTSDPDGLASGRYSAVFVDGRKAERLPRQRECRE